MMNNLTIFNLLNFMPLNEKENELYNFDKNDIKIFNSKLDKGIFYLGGQIKMTHNDFINLELINKVRMINEERNEEYRGPCNSWELASINNALKNLELIENMIIKYSQIMELREKEKLNKTNSNNNI